MSNFFKAFEQFKPMVRIDEYFVYYDEKTGQVLDLSHEKKDMASVKMTKEQRISLNRYAIQDLMVKEDRICLRTTTKTNNLNVYSCLMSVNTDQYGYQFQNNNIHWPTDKQKGLGKNFLYEQD